MALFALLVSTAFGALLRETPREQIKVGARVFGALVGLALLFAWLMYPLPL
jgi:hypothetical protein